MAKQFDFSHQFMYVDNDADRLLYAARFMVVVLGVVLGVLLFCWVNEWLGFEAAVVALAFYTIEPNIAAHSSLVTTDFGVACFIFGAIYFLWRTCRRPSALNITGLTAFFVLAIISKFSALILGPIAVLLLAFATFRLRTLKLVTALGILVLLASTSWMAIWGVYGFRYTPSASDTWVFHFQDNPLVLQRVPALAGVVNWIDSRRLLPNIFTQGFLLSQEKAQVRGAFLAGSYSTDGWWYYFPVAFFIKTPVALIILFLGGIAAYVKRRRLWGLEGMAFVVLPIALYLGSAMTARINIGLRHILPIYPLVLFAAAAAVLGSGVWPRVSGQPRVLQSTGRRARQRLQISRRFEPRLGSGSQAVEGLDGPQRRGEHQSGVLRNGRPRVLPHQLYVPARQSFFRPGPVHQIAGASGLRRRERDSVEWGLFQ
jgi:hypothetical protein